MATTNIIMRMDEELKAPLQELVSNLVMDIPNADTIRAIDDVRHGRNLSRAFSSVEELMEDLNAED